MVKGGGFVGKGGGFIGEGGGFIGKGKTPSHQYPSSVKRDLSRVKRDLSRVKRDLLLERERPHLISTRTRNSLPQILTSQCPTMSTISSNCVEGF
jgi:hypothetical protein